jgi:hypothetical protein
MNDLPGPFAGKQKLPFLWTEKLKLELLSRLPSRYHVGRRRSRSKSRTLYPADEDLTSLNTSFNFRDGLRELQGHEWQNSDLQYVFLVGLALFSLWIAPPAPALKFFGLMGMAWLCLMPATRQFFFPALPIWTWLVYFFCSR